MCVYGGADEARGAGCAGSDTAPRTRAPVSDSRCSTPTVYTAKRSIPIPELTMKDSAATVGRARRGRSVRGRARLALRAVLDRTRHRLSGSRHDGTEHTLGSKRRSSGTGRTLPRTHLLAHMPACVKHTPLRRTNFESGVGEGGAGTGTEQIAAGLRRQN